MGNVRLYWKCRKGKDLMFWCSVLHHCDLLCCPSGEWELSIVELWAEQSSAWTFSRSLARKDLPWWDISFLNGPTLSHTTACVLGSQRDWRAASGAFPLVSQMRDPEYWFCCFSKNTFQHRTTRRGLLCFRAQSLTPALAVGWYKGVWTTHRSFQKDSSWLHTPWRLSPKGWEND